MASETKKKTTRRTFKESLKREVLAEAGYRCAVPTCRTILAIDLHHIVEVKDEGPNELSNLLALCPTCHALYTRGTISKDVINVWKTIIVALNHAFDQETISNLLFLNKTPPNTLAISGDGVLKFSHLIASGLAKYNIYMQNGCTGSKKLDTTRRDFYQSITDWSACWVSHCCSNSTGVR